MFGVINLNKPLHLTSHDVVAKVRRKLGIKKVGHCGTLDPLAEGVLPVCVGNATRLIEYFPDDKRYRAEITLGLTTLTWDAEGEVLQTVSAEHITKEQLQEALSHFQGKILQQVPPHAAVHVKGKKLYEYARQGIVVELPVRETTLFETHLMDFQKQTLAHPVVTLEIHCSKGTYIRSIAKALGDQLGCGAFLSALTRTSHGKFLLEESVTLETFLEAAHPDVYLQNPINYLPLPQCSLSSENMNKIGHGMKLQPDELALSIHNNQHYLLVYEGMPTAIAIGEASGRLKPLKVFSRPPA